MAEMFSEEALQLVDALLSGDLLDNTILMDVRAHGWFDDYRFGIWPVQQDGRWYGKIFRFEQGGCDIDGEWMLAAAAPAKAPLPAHGQRETSLEQEARERDEKEREEDRTPYNLTNEPILQELLKVHFETCLHWHVKGMGHLSDLATTPKSSRAVALPRGHAPWVLPVEQIPARLWRAAPLLTTALEVTRWTAPVPPLVFLAFFGFAVETRWQYALALGTTGAGFWRSLTRA
ncbi:hypothetical protein B0H14DRAFT_3529387 [Mycena olivaceomarginata]|nr:hypothetical protein B0H14DRAFT_3529387 [Mycena olivaceomarginata]